MAQSKEGPISPFLQPSNVMKNGYFGKMDLDTSNLNCVNIDKQEEVVSLRRSVDLGYITSTTTDTNDDPRHKYRETDEVELEEASPEPRYRDMSALMKEYNVNYSGLVIIPWDEFADNPRKLNDLFYLEKNGFITYDPDEVNVFFHATKMNKPTFGDISENGKAWVINVKSVRDLEQVRVNLLERASVFGVTLVRKTSRFGKSDRAPCLVMLDPTMGHSESIHSYIMRCINVMQEGKKFALEINLNGCVERWCRRITMTTCDAVGARLVITNGEERETFTDAENVICCIVCLPFWSIGAGIYKLHRHSQYKDLELKFDAEEMFLHGSLGSVKNQRSKLFMDYQKEIFRTKPMEESGKEFQEHADTNRHDEHKYISVKKAVKNGNVNGNVDGSDRSYVLHSTTSINNLVTRDNEKLKNKMKKSNFETNSQIEAGKSLEQYSTKSNDSGRAKSSFETNETGKSQDNNPISSSKPKESGKADMFTVQTLPPVSSLCLREHSSGSDSSGTNNGSKNAKFKSMLEVESGTMEKALSPIPSVRTVNSDIMIITQSNDEETPEGGNGSEMDLKTFLKTELKPSQLDPISNPSVNKKKTKKHKKNSSKPPKAPSKKKLKNNKEGVDNSGFDDDSENKFRRVLPSKLRSQDSLDTLDSNECLETESSMYDGFGDSRETIDQIEPENNEVITLSQTLDDDDVDVQDENNDETEEKVFQKNDRISKYAENVENSADDISESEQKGADVFMDEMSCDDLELSDFDADVEDRSESETEGAGHCVVRNSTSAKKLGSKRGTAPYRSNRQKYIGMNTSIKHDRFLSDKKK